MGKKREVVILVLKMSASENISLWKKKSEIDYMPLFISLWLAFNAWIKGQFRDHRDRDLINDCKSISNPLKDKFSELMDSDDASGNRFKANLAELERSLANANIPFEKKEWKKQIGFGNSIIEWNDGNPKCESVLKEKSQRDKIQIDDGLWVDDDYDRLFAAYIEIAYQVRCSLFHGNLSPNEKNERVVKQLYLTLSMIMEKV